MCCLLLLRCIINFAGHCTFEGGFCGWTNDVEDDFDWELGRSSRSFLTGPSRDFSSYNRDEQTGKTFFFIQMPVILMSIANNIF